MSVRGGSGGIGMRGMSGRGGEVRWGIGGIAAASSLYDCWAVLCAEREGVQWAAE
jgi:hypothetical protein